MRAEKQISASHVNQSKLSLGRRKNMQQFDILVRRWIVEVLNAHAGLLSIALQQRAKFEGWLKFELASYAQTGGASAVEVEASLGDSGRARCDLAFHHGGKPCYIELKTCNTNWRMRGVVDLTRPITKNVAKIVEDAKKLRNCLGQGVVAFCMFPVSSGDRRWTEYLKRISTNLDLPLSAASHSDRVSVSLHDGCEADVVIVTFAVPKGR